MSSLEFTAKIEGGVIHLPKEFEEYENEMAHVIVTLETAKDDKSKKEKLLQALKKAQKANLFAKIEDPVEWQKKLRDEWE